jgi:hypothetical protein
MPYAYKNLRDLVLTAQRDLLKVLRAAEDACRVAGVVRADKLMSAVEGDGWYKLALIDRLVELGELREVMVTGSAGQDRVFVMVREPTALVRG